MSRHTGGGGQPQCRQMSHGLKKCHILFEWPLTLTLSYISISKSKNNIELDHSNMEIVAIKGSSINDVTQL